MSALFSPTQLGALQLRNRIALAPLTRARAGDQRLPNALMAEYYAQRASAGLLISEATTISPGANGWVGSPGLYTDEQTRAWRHVTDAVHAHDTPIVAQLWHTGRASHSDFLQGNPPVAPSPIPIQGDGVHTPNGKQPHETPRALDLDELPALIDDYRRAATHAKAAGFDGVEVHSANGYLLDTFLQSKTNHRTDAYGGSLDNRYRLLAQVLDAVIDVWGADRVGVRLSPNGVFNDMGSKDFRESFAHTTQQLDRLGLAYLHVMDGLAFGFHDLGDPITLDDVRQTFSGPVIGNCGYTPQTAADAVASGRADAIAFGRPFIANPDLPERIRNGYPLAESDPDTWYSGEQTARGYTDYPPHTPSTANANA